MNGHGKFYCLLLRTFSDAPSPLPDCPRLWKILLSKFTKTKHNQRISLWIFVPPKPKCCLIKVNKSNFGAIGVENMLLSSQMATFWKTKDIWSYLNIWGIYDPTESGPSEPKQGMLCGCSITNLDPQYPTFISTYVKGCYLVNIYFIINVKGRWCSQIWMNFRSTSKMVRSFNIPINSLRILAVILRG